MKPPKGTTIRALIVDDSEDIINLNTRVLNSRQAIEVVGSARNGAEAAAKSKELLPEVVIMDVEMPIMDGLEATRLIKANRPAIVVVLVSGSAELMALSASAGADGYITKHFSADGLIGKVLDVSKRNHGQ